MTSGILRKYLSSVCIIITIKIEIKWVQTFNPYTIRNLVPLRLLERIYVSSSCFWPDFILQLNPPLMHASLLVSVPLSGQLLCLAF